MSTAISTAFAALADPTRCAILQRLTGGETSVGEVAAPFALSLPAISRHLSMLERAQLIPREGRPVGRCRLQPEGFKVASTWLQRYERFWSESLERLAEHLQELSADQPIARERTIQPMAMAKPKPDERRVLRLTRTFQAPRARVFRAWTDPEQLIKWRGPKAFTVPDCAIDSRPGGAWRTTMRSPEGKDLIVSGVYREILPPSRLVFTWGWEDDGARGHETVVTIELLEAPGGTRLELTHEMFESEDSRDRHQHGWSSWLDCLEQALAERAIQ